MDSWRCPKCEDFKEATKTMDLWSTPPLLCVHLKRFSVDAESFWVDKLETPVSFPTERFDLRPFCVNPDNHQVSKQLPQIRFLSSLSAHLFASFIDFIVWALLLILLYFEIL